MEWADWIYVQKTFAFMSIILGFVLVCAFPVYRFSGGKCARFIQAALVLASKLPLHLGRVTALLAYLLAHLLAYFPCSAYFALLASCLSYLAHLLCLLALQS